MEAHTPLHLRIQAALRSWLESGECPPDRVLPGEHALAIRFGVARMTLRRALAALEAEGLIRREPGRGTWPVRREAMAGVQADIRHFTQASAVRVLGCEALPAPGFVAQMLGIAAGVQVLALQRVRGDGAGPFSHVATWVPAALLEELDLALLGSGAVLEALAERGHVGAGASQWLSGVAADPDVAAALGIPPGSALTRLDRLVCDAAGQPIEFSRSLYRPDRFVYAVPLGATTHPPRWIDTPRLGT